MITKKQFCEMMITEEEKHGPLSVYQSSTYAVCKDFLGELEGEESEYAKTRGGCVLSGLDRSNNYLSLSVRELIELLPDEEGMEDEQEE